MTISGLVLSIHHCVILQTGCRVVDGAGVSISQQATCLCPQLDRLSTFSLLIKQVLTPGCESSRSPSLPPQRSLVFSYQEAGADGAGDTGVWMGERKARGARDTEICGQDV